MNNFFQVFFRDELTSRQTEGLIRSSAAKRISRREIRGLDTGQRGRDRTSSVFKLPPARPAKHSADCLLMKAIKRTDAIWVYTPQAPSILSSMRPLQPPDSFHVEAARGWLELGDPLEAERELGQIASKLRNRPEVIEVLWQISARKKEWDVCVDLANQIIKALPKRIDGYIHKAYALHESKRTHEAWELLFPLAEKFPKDVTIKYNLACYGVQLGRHWEALQWLKLAFTIGKESELRPMALSDPDLKPLWPKIAEL